MKDYKAIWNNLSATFEGAGFYVCCTLDEDSIRSNGEITAKFLQSVLQIEPTDKVLEIGCGVARIGRELASSCGEWHGCDISGNMIAHARQRTEGISNIYLHELPDNSLHIFPDNSFDCIYSTIVFMHLDKPDMFTYIREAYRVLKLGGRVYFDTYNLLAPGAWQEFLKILGFSSMDRPGHISQFSTPQEMQKFMEEAGFDKVHIDAQNPQLVVALGHKTRPNSVVQHAQPVQPIPLEVQQARHDAVDVQASIRPPARPEPLRRSANEEGTNQESETASIFRQQQELQERLAYIEHLESEMARKNVALNDLTTRYQRLEQELITARSPRPPWKRRKASQ